MSAYATGSRVDVAIVGGGYTGLSTALHAAEKGLSVQLFEAQQIGFGGSGRNAGLVNAALWLSPAEVRKKLGEDYGSKFFGKLSNSPKTVFDLIEKHQIRCEVTRTGTIHAANSATGFEDLRKRHADWQRMGQPVDLLSRDEVSRIVGTSVYHGGLLDHRAGTINPMAYCRGLSRAASAAGARISTGINVLNLRKDPLGWRVVTSDGDIHARHVILGTNAYTGSLWPGLSKVFSTIDYLQFATKPLGQAGAHIMPGRQGLWDTGPIMFSYRRDQADRLIVGTMGRVIGSAERGLTRRWAQRQIERIFPDLGPVEFDTAWHGKIAMTPDHLPRIIQLDDGVWTAIGYNGRGITTGTLFGQLLSEIVTGLAREDIYLPVTNISAAPFGKTRSRLMDLAFTVNQLWKSI